MTVMDIVMNADTLNDANTYDIVDVAEGGQKNIKIEYDTNCCNTISNCSYSC